MNVKSKGTKDSKLKTESSQIRTSAPMKPATSATAGRMLSAPPVGTVTGPVVVGGTVPLLGPAVMDVGMMTVVGGSGSEV